MKKKLNEIKESKKMAFEKVSILELNQLKTIKGGIGENGDGGNDNTFSLTDIANDDKPSAKCSPSN